MKKTIEFELDKFEQFLISFFEFKGARAERERIITSLTDKDTAKSLIILAKNTTSDNPKEIQDAAWVRIREVLSEEQK